MIPSQAVTTLLDVAGKFASISQTVDKINNSNLAEIGRVARVEPIVLMDRPSTTLPYITDVLQNLTFQYAGMYLQAVSLLVNVGDVNTRKLLESLNPHAGVKGNEFDGVIGAAASKIRSSMEDYQYKLPDPTLPNLGLEAIDRTTTTTTSTSTDENGRSATSSNKETTVVETDDTRSASFGRDLAGQISEMSSLAVGVMLEVNIESNGQRAVIPVSVRMAPSVTPPNALVHILSYAEKNVSLKERWYGWRSGELRFVQDIILCNDLIEAHTEALKHDKSGVYQQILQRRRNNMVSALKGGAPAINTASNIIVMTSETANKVEHAIGGRLKNMPVRERIFKNTYMMIMVVIDNDYEMVTVYTRGIANPAIFPVKAMKSSNKNGGPDVAEILKAYKLGTSPTSI